MSPISDDHKKVMNDISNDSDESHSLEENDGRDSKMYNSLISPAKPPGEEESKVCLINPATRISEVVEFPNDEDEIDGDELFSSLAVPDDSDFKRESFGRLTEKLVENT